MLSYILTALMLWEVCAGKAFVEGSTTVTPTATNDNVSKETLLQEVKKLTLLLEVFLLHPESQTRECRSPFVEVGGRCVVVMDAVTGSWQAMRNHCQHLGGDLVKLHDANFMADLVSYINQQPFSAIRYWTGASDAGQEGNWRWTDGSPVRMGTPFWGDYNDQKQQPQGGPGEGCANIPRDDHFFMHDGPCREVNSAICEY